jgi:hypothetical protein
VCYSELWTVRNDFHNLRDSLSGCCKNNNHVTPHTTPTVPPKNKTVVVPPHKPTVPPHKKPVVPPKPTPTPATCTPKSLPPVKVEETCSFSIDRFIKGQELDINSEKFACEVGSDGLYDDPTFPTTMHGMMYW